MVSLLILCVDSKLQTLVYGKAMRILNKFLTLNKINISEIYYTSEENKDTPVCWLGAGETTPTRFDFIFAEYCPLLFDFVRNNVQKVICKYLKPGSLLFVPDKHVSMVDIPNMVRLKDYSETIKVYSDEDYPVEVSCTFAILQLKSRSSEDYKMDEDSCTVSEHSFAAVRF